MQEEQQKEQVRVDNVLAKIKASIQKQEAEVQKAEAERSLVEKNYVQNARINTLEVDDQMETNAEVQQQKQLVAKNLENETILKNQLEVLKLLKDSPYFGRIDIQDPGDDVEQLYIGTASYVDENQDFLIYDWRAPISSIYYNGTLGSVAYETPGGQFTTELLKKRQFNIQEGQIVNMFDTNETIGDEILQAVLGQQSDEYMHNIVATIQKEQNDIIRDTYHDLLLVQGVAGSGKTSAILQRIAFLLYHSRTELSADQIVLFSPNLLFSHYISEVLPSLGEKNMQQVTLAQFLAQRLQGLKVQTLFERYEEKEKLSAQVLTARQEKEAANFMHLVESYVDTVPATDLKFNDLYLEGQVVFTKEEILALYQELPSLMQPKHRFEETKKQLFSLLKKRIRTESHQDWAQEAVNYLSDQEYHQLLVDKSELEDDYQGQLDYLAYQLVKKKFAPIYDAIYNNFFFDAYAQYSHFLEQVLPNGLASYNENLEFHQLALEDCAPLLYLRDLLTGNGQNRSVAHLFIDEMQDYTLAQLIYLHHAFPKAKLTLLGDAEQALFNPLMSPRDFLQKLQENLGIKKSRVISLNKSYRSTKNITDYMKAILPDGDLIQAFTRQGDLPRVLVSNNQELGLATLKKEIQAQLAQDSTVALITKDAQQSQELYYALHQDFDLTLLNNNDQGLPKGVIILPIYLAKGLEFDNVIAVDVSATNYHGPDSLGILYTICSRAMHHLTLISFGPLAEPLKKIDPDLYQLQADFYLA